MKINSIYKGGILLILIGLIIKITTLILDVPNSFFAGMTFSVIGIGLIGYAIYRDKIIINKS